VVERQALLARHKYIVSRLHYRYDAKNLPNDPQLGTAPAASGGHRAAQGQGRRGSTEIKTGGRQQAADSLQQLPPWVPVIMCKAGPLRWARRGATTAPCARRGSPTTHAQEPHADQSRRWCEDADSRSGARHGALAGQGREARVGERRHGRREGSRPSGAAARRRWAGERGAPARRRRRRCVARGPALRAHQLGFPGCDFGAY
jgi:hypothetical protein